MAPGLDEFDVLLVLEVVLSLVRVGVSMLAHSFLTGIKARMSSISGLWFPWPIYMFFEMRFDLGTLDSGEQLLPFGLLVIKIVSD